MTNNLSGEKEKKPTEVRVVVFFIFYALLTHIRKFKYLIGKRFYKHYV